MTDIENSASSDGADEHGEHELRVLVVSPRLMSNAYKKAFVSFLALCGLSVLAVCLVRMTPTLGSFGHNAPLASRSTTNLQRVESRYVSHMDVEGSQFQANSTDHTCFDLQFCQSRYAHCSEDALHCLQATEHVMNSSDGLGDIDIYASRAWYPRTPSNPLRFQDFQTMIYLYDKSCPRPCEVASAPTQVQIPAAVDASKPAVVAAESKPRRCPPNSDGRGADPRRPPAPKGPLDYNGISWPELCFEGDDDEHVLLIGDWGGVSPGVPAKQTGRGTRVFVEDIDGQAQYLVAAQFNERARQRNPRYVLNVGDNFYWGGCKEACASKTMAESIAMFHEKLDKKAAHQNCSHQFYQIFETMYFGPGLDGKPWFSTLGNHDYGGCHFWAAWDQQIAYTWGPSGRWVMPSLYYHLPVVYPTKNFTVDYFVIDTNIADTGPPEKDVFHNICGKWNNMGHSCAPFGPRSAEHCERWFWELWQEQLAWLRTGLDKSTADWQIILTHFPPETCVKYSQMALDLKVLGEEFGIDLIIAGHRHLQAMYENGENGFSTTAGIPYVVTGGGGGITSDGNPGADYPGGQDMYGFMDMRLTKSKIEIEAISEQGEYRGTMSVWPRQRAVAWQS